jgi:Ca2+-binding RTX toxin-like protein
MAIITGGSVEGLNMDELLLAGGGGDVVITSATGVQITGDLGGGYTESDVGSFTYTNGALTGGTLTQTTVRYFGSLVYSLSGFSLSIPQLVQWIATDNVEAYKVTILGSDDLINGTPFDDLFRAYGGNDTINGGAGNDILYGGQGNDTIDGGSGAVDVAGYVGASALYTWSYNANGTWSVSGPEGNDTLRNIEVLQFTDRTVALVIPAAIPAILSAAYTNILRGSATDNINSNTSAAMANDIAAGRLTSVQAVQKVVQLADATTSVATMSYEFFTGKVPTAGGVDYLVSTTGGNTNNLNSGYYQSFNLENRYINFAVNLGKFGEGQGNFSSQYGALTLAQATQKAYGIIFGVVPTDAKVAELLSGGRDEYFNGYGHDGLNGIGTKAAMVGWLLAEAAKADVGMYSKANNAFLTDLADGATFAVDLIGVYGKPEYAYG